MRKTISSLLLLTSIIFISCSVKKTYIHDYSFRIELIKINFPEVYDLYRQGDVIIDNVYTYYKDGHERVHVSYRYR